MAVPGDDDPFFECVALRLVHLKYNRQIPDPDEFEHFLAQRPELNSMLQEKVAALHRSEGERKHAAHGDDGKGWVGDDGWAT
jgi:hypothetical protein